MRNMWGWGTDSLSIHVCPPFSHQMSAHLGERAIRQLQTAFTTPNYFPPVVPEPEKEQKRNFTAPRRNRCKIRGGGFRRGRGGGTDFRSRSSRPGQQIIHGKCRFRPIIYVCSPDAQSKTFLYTTQVVFGDRIFAQSVHVYSFHSRLLYFLG